MDIIYNFYKSRDTMLKIAKYQGYDVDNSLFLNYDEFRDKYINSSMEIEEVVAENDEDVDINQLKRDISMTFTKGKISVYVTWINENKLGGASLKDLVEKMTKDIIQNAFVISQEGIVATCQSTIKMLKVINKINISIWTFKDSLIFIPDHVHVPPHRICSVKEKNNIMKTYALNKHQIPIISYKDDVMVKTLGATKGQLIEILRPSETDPTFIIKTYRIVL